MYLIYLDSSGSPLIKEPEDYVLSAIIVNESNWTMVDNKVKSIKLTHFPNIPDSKVEFHAKDMENNTGIYKNMTHNQILNIFDSIYGLFASQQYPDFPASLISIVVQKGNLRKRDLDLEVWAHRLIYERLNKFINKKNQLAISNGKYVEYGLMIEDTEGTKKDENLRNKLRRMLIEGTLYSTLDYLIEDPFFTDSKWRNLSQLVDCVAYCVRREYKLNQTQEKKKVWDRYFKIISNRFDKTVSGSYNGYGIKIFP